MLDKYTLEICNITVPPSKRIENNGIDQYFLDWRNCTIAVHVYEIKGGRIGSRIRNATPIVVYDAWRTEIKKYMAKAKRKGVALGAGEWSQETVKLVQIREHRESKAHMTSCRTDDADERVGDDGLRAPLS